MLTCLNCASLHSCSAIATSFRSVEKCKPLLRHQLHCYKASRLAAADRTQSLSKAACVPYPNPTEHPSSASAMQGVVMPNIAVPGTFRSAASPVPPQLSSRVLNKPLQVRSNRSMQSRRQPAPVSCMSESAPAPALKLEDVQDMYTQLAHRTQTLYEQEQRKTRQLSLTREELVEKMTLLAKAKGICSKLLHRSKKHRSQLETELVQARNQSTQEEEEEGGSIKLQETMEELHRAKKDAEYYKQKWYQSQDEIEQQASKSRRAKQELARELDVTKTKLRRLARVL